MIVDSNHLAKKRDFDLLLKHGRWARGLFLDVKVLKLAEKLSYAPKQEDPDKFVKQLKLAISVGLKISKKAVARNRLKRQVREAARLLLQEFGVNEGFYVLIAPRPAALTKNFAELSQDLKLLLLKNKILKAVPGNK